MGNVYNSEHIVKQDYWGSGDTGGWQDYSHTFAASGTGHFDIDLWWWQDPGYSEPGYFYIDQVEYLPIPEPATLLLFGGGAIAFAGLRRIRLP